jgi:hypothetical protein
MTSPSSTLVGDWAVLKVNRAADPFLASRWSAAAAGQGSQDRNIKAIASRLTSTNTIVVR